VGREILVNWAALLALGFGLLAGLGMLRSVRWVFGTAVALMLVQVAFWTTFLAFADERASGSDWNVDLAAAFFLSLTAVVPYVAVGAVITATATAVLGQIGRSRAGKW
jgi:hypothetical protein